MNMVELKNELTFVKLILCSYLHGVKKNYQFILIDIKIDFFLDYLLLSKLNSGKIKLITIM